MRRLVVAFMAATLACAGVVPAQAALVFNFEPPTYSLGALDGQDGWVGNGDVQNTTVLAGTQSLAIIGQVDHAAVGTGYGDGMTMAYLTQFGDGNAFSQVNLHGTGGVEFARLGMQAADGGQFYARNGGSFVFSPAGAAVANTTYAVSVSFNFTNQQYQVSFDDGVNTPFNLGPLNFVNATTAAQAEAGFLRLLGGTTGSEGGYFDSIVVGTIPEPGSIVLLSLGLATMLLGRCHWHRQLS